MRRQIQKRPKSWRFATQRRTWRLLVGSIIVICAQTGFVSAEDFSALPVTDLLQYHYESGASLKPGELIVRFVETDALPRRGQAIYGPRTKWAIRTAVSDFIVTGASVDEEYDRVVSGLTLVKLPEGTSVSDAINKFMQSSGVLYAEPNYKIRALVIPNDPQFTNQWALNNVGQTGGLEDADIDAPEAWNILSNAPGIIVAVADTGIDYNHPDLANNMWINDGEVNVPGTVDANDINDVDDDENGYADDFYGADFVDNDGDPNDEHFHGTHVAGIIGAVGNNGTGISGVCWSVRLMSLRILDAEGEGTVASAVSAIQYAVTMGADIINASWGSYYYDQSLYDAIAAAGQAGVLLVAAAGNDGYSDANTPGFGALYPAAFGGVEGLDNVISVMATDEFDLRAWFSNYSARRIDLGAPGNEILSTMPTFETDAMGDLELDTDYGILSGTSQAAPHVTGACALLRAIGPGLTHVQVKKIIMRSVDPVLPGLCVSGGRLNLYQALLMGRPGAVIITRTYRRYPTIQLAIDAARTDDVIIADSNHWYIGTVNFKGKTITVRSGDVNAPPLFGTPSPENTYISGLFDDGTVVTFDQGEGTGTILRGFTIVDGTVGTHIENSSPQINECVVTDNSAGGVFCGSNALPEISDCNIASNMTGDNGGGLYCAGDSEPNLFNCAIVRNSASGEGGGIYCDEDSRPKFSHCTISGNMAEWEGGGIFCIGSSPDISDCVITSNRTAWDGAGIYCDEGSEPNIVNCTITDNVADYDGGGIYCNGTSPLVKNCLIVNNSVDSWDGGGVFCFDSSPTILNCTFVGNSSNDYDGVGGALCCVGISSPTVTNCIFNDNNDIAIYEYDEDADIDVTFCLFYLNKDGDYYDKDSDTAYFVDRPAPGNVLSGRNNFSGDPMFVGGRLGNYYLSQYEAGQILDPNGQIVDPNINPEDATSPAVDAGSDEAVTLEMHLFSTRTDNYEDPNGHKDLGQVDIGYHYNDPIPTVQYFLTTDVDPGGVGSITPDPSGNPHTYTQYTQVVLTATPIDPNVYQFKAWSGTDDDTRRDLTDEGKVEVVQINIVTMDSDKTIVAQFQTILVRLRARIVGGDGRVSPRTGSYPRGTVVELAATPVNPASAVRWSGTDDDYSTVRTNTVTMDEPFFIDPQGREFKEVEVTFYLPRTIDVPGDYTYLQAAIDAAEDGDIIVIAAANEPYLTQEGFWIEGKAVTITGTNPDDPCVVASTVISQGYGDEAGVGQPFVFYMVNRDTVLSGITIRGFTLNGTDGLDGDTGFDPPYWDGIEGTTVAGSIVCYMASPTIKNCIIADCNTSGGDGGTGANGGAEHPDGGHGGWPGAAWGGGMACLYGSNPYVINCTFQNCRANGGNGGDGGDADNQGGWGGNGGGWYYSDPPPTPYEWGPFGHYTEYSGRGGAVYVGEGCFPAFIHCTFTDNRSNGGNCGISGLSQVEGLRYEPSENWKIDTSGGAVFCEENSSAVFIGCEFNDNVADMNSPEGNAYRYVSFGGAVAFHENATPNFESCIFTGNQATVGGAVFGRDAQSLVEDCSFFDNSGFRGGGAYFAGGAVEVARSYFGANQAVSRPTSDPNDPNVSAIQQMSGSGGALCCFQTKSDIIDNWITNNRAGASGGGLWISGSEKVLLKNCLINDNSAGRDGGGISINRNAQPIVSNCTISDNIVTSGGFDAGYGGGLYCSYGSFTNIIDTIIWNNLAGTGSQIAVTAGSPYDPILSTVNISYSNIHNLQPRKFVPIDANTLPVIRPGFSSSSLPANDDESTGLVNIGFEINYFGKAYSQLYVNNNGNVTFDANMWTYTPFGLTTNIGTSVIAPFFADVDTRPPADANFIPNIATFGPGVVDGHAAFGVNWIDMGYFAIHYDKLCTFQLVLIDRSDRAPGDFDMEFNYETINWETGDASEGVDGFGGYTARAGFSNGTGEPGTFYELGGSGLSGAFLDGSPTGLIHSSHNSDVSGRYVFSVMMGAPEIPIGEPIYVDQFSMLNGWDPDRWDPNIWDPNTHNFSENPLFKDGYYLSQVAAGQDVNSPCVDAGSADVNDPNVALDPNVYTTRTDGFGDVNIVDIGYHYLIDHMARLIVDVVDDKGCVVDPNISHGYVDPNDWFYPINAVAELVAHPEPGYCVKAWTGTDDVETKALTNTVTMIGDRHVTVQFEPDIWDLTIIVRGGHGSVEPGSGIYNGGVIELTAYPDPDYRVKSWIGTDNDPSWNRNTNTVKLDSDKTVVVEFERDITRNLLVPSQYRTIEDAVAAAGGGGTNIIVSPGVHYISSQEGIDLQGKTITLTSTDPDDPAVIASTIIDCQGTRYIPRRAFHFHSGEDPNTIVTGLTIRNGYIRGPIGTFGRYGVFTPQPFELIPVDNPNPDTTPPRAELAGDATGEGYGGAILCENASSPTIKNCIVTNCTVTGGQGGDGAPGQSGTWSWQPVDPEVNVQETQDGQWGGYGGVGYGTGYGGAIACLGESCPVIINCTIKDNIAKGGCGGDGGPGGPALYVGTNYQGEESSGGNGGEAHGRGIGGGIYCEVGSCPVFEGCTFINNIAMTGSGGPGGAIGEGNERNDPGPAWVGFPGNVYPEPGIAGGAAYYFDADPNFINCKFIGNKAREVFPIYSDIYQGIYGQQEEVHLYTIGGALYSGPGNITAINNCQFTDNLGGAVYVGSNNVVDLNDCLFKNNEMIDRRDKYEYQYYPYPYYDTARTEIDYVGGAVYIGPDCNGVNLRDCGFHGNYALEDGGAICCDSDANLTDCSFGGNEAGDNGGAVDVYCDTGDPNTRKILTIDVDSCVFTGNKAIDGMTGWGGGVRFQDFNATFTDCYFMNNTAKNGAGLFLVGGDITLRRAVISSNKAIGGSGIDTKGYLDAFRYYPLYAIDDLQNIDHWYYDPDDGLGEIDMAGGRDMGGGLVCADTHATIEHCILQNNVAEGANGSGGAINFSGGYVNHLVKNCLLTSNTATSEGGAVSCNLFAKPEFQNCTFSGNTAGALGGAIFCDWSSDATITDSVFQKCSNYAIAEEDFDGAVVEYCLFYSNSDGDYGIYDTVAEQTSTIAPSELDVTNIDGDPLFVTGPFGDYYFSQIAAGQSANSPAVDAGSGLASDRGLSTYTTRTDGNEDTGDVDIGYHYTDHSGIPQYNLTVTVVQGHGRVEPSSGTYYAGTLVTLTAQPEVSWRVAGWSGTADDGSKPLTNVVVMKTDRHVTIAFEQTRTIVVGSDTDYTSIQHAIDDANDGDVIIVETGEYYPPKIHPYRVWATDMIEIGNKAITLTGTNPDDPEVVAATVLDSYWFRIFNVGPEAIIDGITIRNAQRDGLVTVNVSPENDDGYYGESMYGGAMQILNASPTIRNCVFVDCSVTGGDGAPGDPGTQQHTVGFDGGWGGKAYGGAVYCGYNSNPMFENCSFTNCFARGGNGGNGGDGALGDKGGRGGGWEWSDSHEEKFANYWWDGWEYGDKLNIIIGYDPYDAYLDPYYKYSGYGGAVYCENYSAPKFIDCSFTNNNTYGGVCGIGGIDAAGIRTPDRNIKIENQGGAVYARDMSSLEFVDSRFIGNSADTSNDFIATDGTPSTVQNNDDPYTSYGGAVSIEDDCSAKFVNCVFGGDEACIGGAVYWSNSTTTIIDCNFTDNVAYHGAGLYSVDSTSTIAGSTIRSNSALAAPIEPNDPNDPNAAIGFVNVLGAGGGYYCLSSVVDISDSVFTDNRATKSGGGIYFGGSDQDTIFSPSLHNCLVRGNSAGRDGGGISVNWYTEPKITNCTIADNIVTGSFGLGYGGGLYCSYDSNTVVTDSIIWGNSSTYEGSQIAVGSGFKYGPRPSTLTILCSDIEPDPDPNEPAKPLDIVFCIDSTGSMYDDIDAVKGSATEIVGLIAENIPDYRIAVVDYRDFNDPNLGYGAPDDYPYQDVVEFTSDLTAVVDGIDSIVAGGGADWPEAVYSALMHCIDGESLGGWRPGRVTRAILLMADAPPHDPEAPTGYTLSTVTSAASALPAPKQILSLLVGNDAAASAYLRNLSAGTGGPMVQAASADEVVDAVMVAIELVTRKAPSVNVEDDCIITSWDDGSRSWDPASHNIEQDPNFTAGNYLSQIASGQPIDSPCVDSGSTGAVDVGLDQYTTRTDGVGDTGTVDMGYHYGEGLTQYRLTVSVVPDPNGETHGYVDPNVAVVYEGYVDDLITLTAYPDEGYKVKEWTGTDDDASTKRINTVTLTEDKHVTIEFEQAARYNLTVVVIDRGEGPHGIIEPNSGAFYDGETIHLIAMPDPGYKVKTWTGTDDDSSTELSNAVTINGASVFVSVEFWKPVPTVISVPSDYLTIQDAVTAAKDGDTIVVDTGRYYGGYLAYALLVDKSIHITSRNPDDPCTVAATVIDGYMGINEFHNLGVAFGSNADANTVLNGFTIENCGGQWSSGDDGDRDEGHPNGEDGGCGDGAGIIIGVGASPVIKNCVIRGNLVYSGDGGDGEDADENNNAGRGGWSGWAHGGGVYCGPDSNPKFINCTIINNTARGGDGGIGGNYEEDGGFANYGGNYSRLGGTDVSTEPNSTSTTTVEGNLWEVWDWDFGLDYWSIYGEPGRTSYFGDYRWYSGFGGGAFCDIRSNVTFVHCEIIGNRTYGGMSGQGGERNEAGRQMEPLVSFEMPSYGAGVYCGRESTVTFRGCTFEDNITSGIIAGEDPNHRLSPYMGYGGGVCAETSATVMFADCNFVGNEADSGGGLYASGAYTTITDCNFTANTALRGAGLLDVDGTIEIIGTDIINNTAATDVNDPNDDNVLCLGAGLCCWSADAYIRDCNVSGNHSNASGGGVYLRGQKVPSLINCLIKDNGAGRDGGGISVNWHNEPLITNCSMVGNAAAGTIGEEDNTGFGGGLFCSFESRCTVTDSIFWDNYALKGSEIAVGTGFGLDPRCASLMVSYSDIKSTPNDVWVDEGCKLTWGNGNISADPLFVDGPRGEYYLSQTRAGQSRNSPCVNSGSKLAGHLSMSQYTTRTDGVPDRGLVDMGYHYPLAEPCKFCDLVFDGIIQFNDFVQFASEWLSEGCSDIDGWCQGADLTFDTDVGFRDLLFFGQCWLVQDTNAPLPDPSEWKTRPYMVTSVSARMTAKTAFDAWGWDVEYYFDCVQGGCHDSSWQYNPIYQDNGLAAGAEYGYKVKARDGVGNETAWSKVAYAGVVDMLPPTPAPHIQTIDANSPNMVIMESTRAYDENGAEYYFDSNDPDVNDSGWQDEPNYIVTGLDPNTEYCFRVRARDESANQNQTVWSPWVCVETPVPIETIPPTPNPMAFDPNSMPSEFWGGGGAFDYYAEMTAVVATDESGGVEYWFECVDEPRLSSLWQVDNTYTVRVGRAGQGLRFRVWARDVYGNKTDPSPAVPTR